MRKYGLLAALVLVIGAAMPAEARGNGHGNGWKNGHGHKKAPVVVVTQPVHHHHRHVQTVPVRYVPSHRHVQHVPVRHAPPRPVVHVHNAPVKVVTRTVPVYVPQPQRKPGLTVRINL